MMSKKNVFVVGTILFSLQCFAQNDFKYKCPNEHSLLPSGCLESMRVANPNRHLQKKERRQLIQLFIKAHVTNRKKYNQDYLLDPKAPIYQLLKANYPAIGKYEGEGGIFIGNIYKYLKTTPEYKVSKRYTRLEKHNPIRTEQSCE